MSEITKDFIKFFAEMILFVIVVSVAFDPENGIIVKTFNYLSYAEPILLQNHIATAISTASGLDGDFLTTLTTSGYPYVIEIYEQSDGKYVSIKPAENELLRTKFSSLKPTPFSSSCSVPYKKVSLKKDIITNIKIKKIITNENNGDCEIMVSL